jgi:excisionase family DNA binding protein
MNAALTVKQVAQRLSVNNRTIYRLVQSGGLPAFKVANVWRFPERDFDSWIEGQKTRASRKRGAMKRASSGDTQEA